MSKQLIFIIVATVLAGGIVAGVWYAVHKPGPRDLSMPPIYEEPGYTQPDDSIVEVPQDTVSYPHDDPDSPYIDLDAKLHVAKYVTLDSEIITINYELKDVALCGNTYKAKQIFIDGVDVVQRLAQLLDADAQKNDWYCTILKNKTKGHTKATDGMLSPGEEIHIIIGKENTDYSFAPHLGISIDRFRPGNSGPTWEGGYPVYVRAEENKIETYTGVYFGTLR